MAAKEAVFVEALSLPTAARAELAQKLLRSLDDNEDADAAGEWAREIERRAQEVLDGTAELVELEDVKREVAASIAKVRKARAKSRRRQTVRTRRTQ